MFWQCAAAHLAGWWSGLPGRGVWLYSGGTRLWGRPGSRSAVACRTWRKPSQCHTRLRGEKSHLFRAEKHPQGRRIAGWTLLKKQIYKGRQGTCAFRYAQIGKLYSSSGTLLCLISMLVKFPISNFMESTLYILFKWSLREKIFSRQRLTEWQVPY